jgi:hypothetical protein
MVNYLKLINILTSMLILLLEDLLCCLSLLTLNIKVAKFACDAT